MINNNYSLPLILDLTDTSDNKKVFTKIDPRQSYNNVRIKKV